MKTSILCKRTLATFLCASLLFTSCKKDKKDNDTSSAGENSMAEACYNDVINIADEAGRTGTLSNYRLGENQDGLLSACATVTFDSTNSTDQDTIHIDFGSVNCLCNDSRNRRGEIIVYYQGQYRDSASIHTITFNNYFVNDNQILGTKTVTNLGHNSLGHLVYDITVVGQIVLANSAGVINWNSQKQREWVQGESTLIWNDDIYSITGTAAGVGANGQSFTVNITSPLIRNMAFGCRRHFVQGVFVITPDNLPARTLDFGTGTCDDIATVTINNHIYTIQLW